MGDKKNDEADADDPPPVKEFRLGPYLHDAFSFGVERSVLDPHMLTAFSQHPVKVLWLLSRVLCR